MYFSYLLFIGSPYAHRIYEIGHGFWKRGQFGETGKLALWLVLGSLSMRTDIKKKIVFTLIALVPALQQPTANSNSETLLMILILASNNPTSILDPAFYLSSVTSACTGQSAQPVTLPWLST